MMKKRIVSTILALCLLLPALPVSARAEEPDGSTPGERGKSLAELFQEDGTIKLSGIADASETLVVPAGKTVVLDLNGYIVNSTASPAIRVEGKLTVKDSTFLNPPTIDTDNNVTYTSGSINTGDARRHAVIVRSGEFKLENGAIKAGNNGIRVEGGKAVISGGYVEATEAAVAVFGPDTSLTIDGGVLLSKDNAVVSGHGLPEYKGTTITMNNGTLIGRIKTRGYIACGIYHPQGGELIVNGGKIIAEDGVGILMRGGNAFINTSVVEPSTHITATGSGVGKVGDAEQQIKAGKEIVLDQKSGYYDVQDMSVTVSMRREYEPVTYCRDGAFAVTLKSGGPEFTVVTTNEHGKLIRLPTPTEEGPDFLGWFIEKESGGKTQVTTETVFTEDTTIWPYWKIPGETTKCVVHFDLNYDTDVPNPEDMTAVCGETTGWSMGEPKHDRNNEYKFIGWYKEPQCVNPWDFEKDIVKGETTLYAKWEKVIFNVVFYGNGGLIRTDAGKPQTSLISGNASDVKATTATWEGCTFLGWYDDPENGEKYEPDQSYVLKKDTYLYAHWEGEPTAPAQYTVTIDRNYDGAPEPERKDCVKVGDKVNDLGEPDRPRGQHTFLGWYKDAEFKEPWNFDTDTVTADVFLYAKWEDSKAPTVPSEFSVTFDLNYESAPASVVVSGIKDGSTVTEPEVPTRTGYTFGDWYKEAACENAWDFDNDTVTGNITLYAKWEDSTVDSEKFTVTFDSQDGSAVDSQEIEKDGKVREPSQPTRTGYTFGGWYREAACETAWDFDNDTVTEDITLYAKWTERSGGDTEEDKTYTITFKLEYAGAEDVIKTTGKDGKLTDWPADPTREGYTFDGWYTASTGGEKAPDAFSSDTTLYAHWTKDDDPDETRYRIYTPGSVSGGSYDVSRSSATQGTRITIEFTPRSGYDLDYLTVTNRSTGEDVPLTERYSDEYYFTMPDSSVDVDIAFSRERPGNVYFDLVPPQAKPGPTAWYYMNRHIYHVTDGMVPDSTPITRDMLISVLYNLTDESLLNVPGAIGSETNNAHAWAVSSGVMPDIYASGLWGMDKSLSREQLALMVFQYAGYRGHSTYQGVELSHYADSRQLRAIAQDAMSWSLATGLLSPVSGTTISPKGTITCGQTGELFYRYQTTIA